MDAAPLLLSDTNWLWLENQAKKMGAKPEATLNAMIRAMRSRIGPVETDLESWLNQEIERENTLLKELEELRKARVVVEETSRTIQLYIEQLGQSEQTT